MLILPMTRYASSNALKGDFTRTGVRSWRGALNDGSSSLTRLLANASHDFFRQAVIDYMLGLNLNSIVEFSSSLTSSDPSNIIRLIQIRETAIEITATIVIAEGETKLGGWTLLGGEENTLRGKLIQEKVVLLTETALYVCSFQYELMKVRFCLSSSRMPSDRIMA